MSFSIPGMSGSSNMLGNYSLADYASIRNGSYSRLLKSYYAKADSSSGRTSGNTSNKTYNYWNYDEKIKGISAKMSSVSKDSAETLDKIQTSAESLSSSAQKVTATEDREKMYSAAAAFVKDYNSLMESSGKSQVGAIKASRSSIVSNTSANAEKLASVGITVNAKDNTLSIDASKFKSADLDTVKGLFDGKSSYAAKISSSASAIASHAKYEAGRIGASTGTSRTASTSSSSRTYNYWDYREANQYKYTNTSTSWDSAATLSSVQKDSSGLRSAADKLTATGSGSLLAGTSSVDGDGGETVSYNRDAIYSAAASFVEEYNNLIKSSADSRVGAISARRASLLGNTSVNSERLSAVGITVDATNKTLSINESKFKSADMDTVKKLFQGSGSYGEKISEAASAINSHAKYEAAKSNTYNNAGSYSSNNASAWSNFA
ncbi:MAG: flagellar filament capping protein FliD [Blautia sp.]|nr:flagellar filament capping protein FliD [Blautia sp.]